MPELSMRRFLWGLFRVALKVGFDEILAGSESRKCRPSGERVGVVVAVPSYVSAEISQGRSSELGQVGCRDLIISQLASGTV